MCLQVVFRHGAALFGGENMLINADCTVYEKTDLSRHIFTGVYWFDCRGQTVTKNGITITDSVLVYIYGTGGYVPKAGDIIVKGAQEADFTAANQQDYSRNMKALRETFPDYASVKNTADCQYGRLAHLEVTAR